jgi:hypothetical protein
VVHASVDGGPSKDWHLSPSTDRLSAFFKSGPQLLERLLASKQLRIGYGRRKPLENDAGELVFSLAGLYEASLPWVEACAVDLDRVKDGLGKLEGD